MTKINKKLYPLNNGSDDFQYTQYFCPEPGPLSFYINKVPPVNLSLI